MALGIVSEKIYNEEVEKYLNGSVISTNKRGPKVGESTEISNTLRKVIGQTYVESGKVAAMALAGGLGISESSAKAYSTGAVGTKTYGNPTGDLGAFITKTKGRISKRAAKLAVRALDNVTDNKLQEASAGELANVARTATAIVKEMEPPVLNGAGNGPQVQFNIYAPTISKEDKYDVIDVVSIDE